MVFFLMFTACLLLIPIFFIRYVESRAEKKKDVKQVGMFGIYARSFVFRGFFDTLVLLVFFIVAQAGALGVLFDGILDVAVHYSVQVNNDLIGLWWITPVAFALAVAWKTVSHNAAEFLRKAAGALAAVALVLMVTGEVVKAVGSTNIVMVINALEDALLYGGYADGTSLAILKLGDIFVAFGTVLEGGILAAFIFSFVGGYKDKKMCDTNNADRIVMSVEQMKRSDKYTIENFVSGKELMKRAAHGVFEAVDWNDKSVAIVTGSGNNGGDGYALAEILAENGVLPMIFRVTDKFSEDGLFYFERAKKLNVEDVMFDSEADLKKFDIIVDCIFGIGFRGVPDGVFVEAINAINESGAYVVSVDINSGLDGDTGEAEFAVKSDLTVSVGYFKKGMFCGKAPELIGCLKNVDIGIVPV